MLTLILTLAACTTPNPVDPGQPLTGPDPDQTPAGLPALEVAEATQDGLELHLALGFAGDATGTAPASIQWDDGSTTSVELQIADGLAEVDVALPDPCGSIASGSVDLVVVVGDRDAETSAALEGTVVDTVTDPSVTFLPGLTVLCGAPTVDVFIPAGHYTFEVPGGGGVVSRLDAYGYPDDGFAFSGGPYHVDVGFDAAWTFQLRGATVAGVAY